MTYELKKEQVADFINMPIEQLRDTVRNTLVQGITELGGPEAEAEVMLNIFEARIRQAERSGLALTGDVIAQYGDQILKWNDKWNDKA